MLNLPKPITSYPRHANRRRGQPANERTYIPSIIPPGATHLDAVVTIVFKSIKNLLLFSSASCSILMDFLIRSTGKGDCRNELLKTLPFIESKLSGHIILRAAKLTFINKFYLDFYNKTKPYLVDSFTPLPMDDENPWIKIEKSWSPEFPYRNDFLRRRAALEIDVLLSLAIGLSVDDLIQVYCVQFSALVGYESVDQYDAKGRRLPNTTRKDAGAKELRDALKNHDGISPITVSWEIDNGNQLVTRTFYPPFRHVDRIEDYKTAYRVFSERLGIDQPEKEIA